MRFLGVGVFAIGCGGASVPATAPSVASSELVCPTSPRSGTSPLATKPLEEGGYQRLVDDVAVATFRQDVNAHNQETAVHDGLRDRALFAAIDDLMPEIKRCMASADPVVPDLQYVLEYRTVGSSVGTYTEGVDLQRITAAGEKRKTSASTCVDAAMRKLALPPDHVGGTSAMMVLRYDECTPKAYLAKAVVQDYASRAYPAWLAVHPNHSCPEHFDDLSSYSEQPARLDPWGHEYKLLCGAALPKGATGIRVMSAGRDGTAGTKDDIESWEASRITRE